jgi:hypothetical protein
MAGAWPVDGKTNPSELLVVALKRMRVLLCGEGSAEERREKTLNMGQFPRRTGPAGFAPVLVPL